ncbi:MAG: FIST C-terminal domain-containing protein [Candidatus Competibacteraceae bacterium]|nr:FIST C-terminal domain-containing protein [Candidatus Competibacteraceae bacterium]
MISSCVYLEAVEPSALDRVLADWRATWPECGVLALLPEAELPRVGVVQESCRALGLPLSGALFPALLLDAEFVARGVWLLRFNRMPPAGLIADLNAPGEDPAERIAAAVVPHLTDRRPTLFAVFDAVLPNVGSILDGWYLKLADRVRYVGVNAGSETFQPMPCLFDRDRLVQNGVLWLLWPDEVGAVIEHGYQVPDEMLTATSTEGNRIVSIDWRPAFEVYQELMRVRYGIDLTRDNFYHYATHFPFGILRANDELIVRIPVALEDDGSLFCVGEIPANAVLALLQGPDAGSTQTVERIARALSRQAPLVGSELLTFYCAGRRLHLGGHARGELAALRAQTGAGCQAGALSLGEIGNSYEWGYPLFHNAALVCKVWDPG